jgi:transposase
MHAATSENLSVFLITPNRDRESFEALVPRTWKGLVVSDDYSIYDHLPQSRHPQCWAHVLRTARDLYEIHGDEKDGKAFVAICDFIRAAKVQRATPSDAHRAAAVRAFEGVLIACFGASHAKLYKLGRRLVKKRRRYLLCLDNPEIPLTNNQVERDIRFSVIARRVSFGTRNETGSEQWAEGVTLSQTLGKQGKSLRTWVPAALTAHQNGHPLPPIFNTRAPPDAAAPSG